MDVDSEATLVAWCRRWFDLDPEGVLLFDALGGCVAANPVAVTRLGEGLVGRSLDALRRRADSLGAQLVVRREGSMSAARIVELDAVEDVDDANLAEAHAELSASNERMRATIESTPGVAVQWYDRTGLVKLWNSASERMFGFSASEAVGRPLDQTIHSPEEFAGFIDVLREVERSGRPAPPAEFTFRRRDGSQGTCLSTVFQIPGAGAEPYFVCMDVDLTERKRVEEVLRQTQKEEVLGRLAGGMAHDFNNLLTAIFGFAELAMLEIPPGTAREHLAHVVDAAQRGAGMTQKLLAFARRKNIQASPISLAGVVARVLPLLRPLLGEQVQVEVVTDSVDSTVMGDQDSAEQLVLNLAVNARDAMPDGGRLRFTTSQRRVDGELYVQLEVSDTGVGMTEEVRSKAFEPFFTTKAMGRGTGLGLSVCQGIVRQAGGRIEVDSAPGRGATFRVLLPATHEAPRVPSVAPPTITHGGSERVLVVEDDPGVRRVMTEALGALGYTVVGARDAEDALEAIERHDPPDLVVTDLVMPGMSGRELAERLVSRRPALRVLIASGYDQEATTLGEGFAFIQKPFTPSQLARRVRDILDRRE